MNLQEVIDLINNIKCPVGKLPFYMRIMYTRQMVAERTFEATKNEIINTLRFMK